MASDTNKNQHECSCGRTFRHNISLKRHQKVAGCEELVERVASPQVQRKAVQEEEAATQIVTASQIAEWQAKVNVPTSTDDTGSIDWETLRATAEEFVDFLHQTAATAGQRLGTLAQVGLRFTLFGGFLVALGWVLLFGISQDLAAAPAHTSNADQALQLQAQSTVNSFLQTLQLRQYDRAHSYLSAKARTSVSSSDLESLAQSLNLNISAKGSTTNLTQSGLVAEVNVRRGSSNHKFTLIQESQGWSVASVSAQ